MGLLSWLGEKISELLGYIDPAVTTGILIFWGGGLVAMSQTNSFTEYGLVAVVGWSIICMIFYMMMWEFRVDAGLTED